jgi:hypothetical protein
MYGLLTGRIRSRGISDPVVSQTPCDQILGHRMGNEFKAEFENNSRDESRAYIRLGPIKPQYVIRGKKISCYFFFPPVLSSLQGPLYVTVFNSQSIK